MEVVEAASLNPPKKPSICNECNLNPSKYTCPGCSLRSCSLPCVKSHKQRTSCMGKRPRSEFVPFSQFDDNLLISDYNLLEEVKRVADSAQRLRNGLCGKPYFKLPDKLRFLKNAAYRRNTKLLLLPSGMSMREKNNSWYNIKKKSIFWTIEWRFHSADVVLTDHGVDENKSLCSVIENHLKPGPWNHQLKPFCKEQLECLKFFICKNPKGTKSPFRELDIKAPISRQLRNIIIMEYPIIHVFLPSSSIDFEVSKDQISLPPKFELKESLDEDATSPKGTYFKEEEIENGASPDPHFSDLMKYINPELVDDCSYPGITKSLLQELGIEQEGTFCDSNTMDVGFSEGRDYDFGQDLQNVYSDLIEETNLDGFLDLEGLFVDDEGEMANDELEEGEIP